MIIHAGDFAYDFDDAGSKTGNAFMNSLQPFAATHPYMASPGNHEAYGTQGGGNFSQVRTDSDTRAGISLTHT